MLPNISDPPITLQFYVQVGLLNVDGYYNNLLALFDNGVKEGFINQGSRDIVLSASNAIDLLTMMEVHTYLFYFYAFYIMFSF